MSERGAITLDKDGFPVLIFPDNFRTISFFIIFVF